MGIASKYGLHGHNGFCMILKQNLKILVEQFNSQIVTESLK